MISRRHFLRGIISATAATLLKRQVLKLPTDLWQSDRTIFDMAANTWKHHELAVTYVLQDNSTEISSTLAGPGVRTIVDTACLIDVRELELTIDLANGPDAHVISMLTPSGWINLKEALGEGEYPVVRDDILEILVPDEHFSRMRFRSGNLIIETPPDQIARGFEFAQNWIEHNAKE